MQGYRLRDGTYMRLDDERRRWVEDHMELAKIQARKFYGRCKMVPLDELEAQALFALSWAAARYREIEGGRFEPYAADIVWKLLCNYVSGWGRMPTGFTVILGEPPNGSIQRGALSVRYERVGSNLEPLELIEVDFSEMIDLITRLRERVPSRWFDCAELYYGQERTFREIGEVLGVSGTMAQKLVRQGLRRAAECLIDAKGGYVGE